MTDHQPIRDRLRNILDQLYDYAQDMATDMNGSPTDGLSTTEAIDAILAAVRAELPEPETGHGDAMNDNPHDYYYEKGYNAAIADMKRKAGLE